MTVTIIVIVVLAWSAGYWQGRARRPADLEAPVQHVTINNGPVIRTPPRQLLIDEHGRYWRIELHKRATCLGTESQLHQGMYTRGQVTAHLVDADVRGENPMYEDI